MIYSELQQTLFLPVFVWPTESAIKAISDEKTHSLEATDGLFLTLTNREPLQNMIPKL